MAKNDSIILDSIIDERVSLKIPSEHRDEVFEYFVVEERYPSEFPTEPVRKNHC